MKRSRAYFWMALAGAALFAFQFVAGDFQTTLLGKFLLFALLAISIDLIWGYAGILSLGHGLFFALGGYAIALSLKLQVGTQGTFHSVLPDFMTWNGLSAVPPWEDPLRKLGIAAAVCLTLPCALAWLFGVVVLRARVSGVYLSIITLVLTAIAQLVFIDQQAYTGGFNGITDLAPLQVFGFRFHAAELYDLIVVIFIALFAAAWWLTHSRFGTVLQAARDAEDRTKSLGYDSASYKIFVYVVSAGIAAIAGGLFVPLNGFISPEVLGVGFSIQAVIWVAIGGRGTLIGAAVGAVFLSEMQSLLSGNLADLWQLVVGVLIVLVVLVLPDGLISLLRGLPRKRVRPIAPTAARVAADRVGPR